MENDAIKCSSVASSKTKFAHIFSKVLLHGGTGIGILPDDKMGNSKYHETKTQDPFNNPADEFLDGIVKEAFLAQLFASISTIKAAYAHLQFAQSPYDSDGIQTSDETIVAELKKLSELKQSHLKKQVNDTDPETTLLLSEILEVKSLQKIFEITIRKLDSELKLKDSEVTFMKEKLADANKDNKLIEKKLYSSGQLAVPESSDLNQNCFLTYLRQTLKSIRSFVRMLIAEMESAGWNLEKAATATEPRASFPTPDHRFYAFESFVCKEMFDGPNFTTSSGPSPGTDRQLYLNRFTELKSVRPAEYLAREPQSPFAIFCRTKYLKLIHPKMESSLFGNTTQRDLIESGDVPDTPFFSTFMEMAKRLWALHCLAQAFDPPVSIFLAGKGSRFSEVYMESVNDEVVLMTETDPRVAFGVVPGFRIGKTIIQCQVYLC